MLYHNSLAVQEYAKICSNTMITILIRMIRNSTDWNFEYEENFFFLKWECGLPSLFIHINYNYNAFSENKTKQNKT